MKKQNLINLVMIKIYIKKVLLTKTQKRVFNIIAMLLCVLFFQYLIWYIIPHVLADELIPKDNNALKIKEDNSGITESPSWTSKISSFWENNKEYIIAGIMITIGITLYIVAEKSKDEPTISLPRAILSPRDKPDPLLEPSPSSLPSLPTLPSLHDKKIQLFEQPLQSRVELPLLLSPIGHNFQTYLLEKIKEFQEMTDLRIKQHFLYKNIEPLKDILNKVNDFILDGEERKAAITRILDSMDDSWTEMFSEDIRKVLLYPGKIIIPTSYQIHSTINDFRAFTNTDEFLALKTIEEKQEVVWTAIDQYFYFFFESQDKFSDHKHQFGVIV